MPRDTATPQGPQVSEHFGKVNPLWSITADVITRCVRLAPTIPSTWLGWWQLARHSAYSVTARISRPRKRMGRLTANSAASSQGQILHGSGPGCLHADADRD